MRLYTFAVMGLLGLGCSSSRLIPGVVQPSTGERLKSIPGPMSAFGPSDTVSDALQAACPVIRSKPHATAGRPVALAGCLGSLFAQPAAVAVEDDRSIVFPQFFERAPIEVGVPGQPYRLDGVTLRAIAIAANDFLPPGGADTPCVDRQEAHVYRVIRQGDIIFVRIDENPEHCGRKHGGLDSGAKYAISQEGRILRRVLDGLEEYEGPADGGSPVPGQPGVSPSFNPEHLPALPFLHPNPGDAGEDATMDGGGDGPTGL